MGNYVDFEQDFVMRTMLLLEQYHEEVLIKKPYHEQFNYTLLINCLLGLIVMPKEKILSVIPTDRLTQDLKTQMGLVRSEIPGTDFTIRSFVQKLRHSIAHFDIEVQSSDEELKFDFLLFKDTENKQVFAKFAADEIYPFLMYYTDCLNRNIENKKRIGA